MTGEAMAPDNWRATVTVFPERARNNRVTAYTRKLPNGRKIPLPLGVDHHTIDSAKRAVIQRYYPANVDVIFIDMDSVDAIVKGAQSLIAQHNKPDGWRAK